MNSPNSVVIVQQKNPLDLKKCVICKNVRDSKGEKKLTSTEKGRKTLIECSNVLKDDLFKYLKLEELSDIKYHVNTCYPRYVRQKEQEEKRKNAQNDCQSTSQDIPDLTLENQIPEQRAKRRKMHKSTDCENKCIICDQRSYKGDEKKLRISVMKRAKQFLSATKFFKDDVYTRTIFLNNVGDVFAADILYHRNCLSNYILKFRRDLQLIMDNEEDTMDEDGVTLVDEIIEQLNLKNEAYHLSDVRDMVNKRFLDNGFGKTSLILCVQILKDFVFYCNFVSKKLYFYPPAGTTKIDKTTDIKHQH